MFFLKRLPGNSILHLGGVGASATASRQLEVSSKLKKKTQQNKNYDGQREREERARESRRRALGALTAPGTRGPHRGRAPLRHSFREGRGLLALPYLSPRAPAARRPRRLSRLPSGRCPRSRCSRSAAGGSTRHCVSAPAALRISRSRRAGPAVGRGRAPLARLVPGW